MQLTYKNISIEIREHEIHYKIEYFKLLKE